MTGGTNYETGYLSTVESFPLTCSIPDMPTVRYGHTTSLLPTSPPTLVVCGGYCDCDGLFSSDPAPYDCVAWRSGMAAWSEHSELGYEAANHSTILYTLPLGCQDPTTVPGCPTAKTTKLFCLEGTVVRL